MGKSERKRPVEQDVDGLCLGAILCQDMGCIEMVMARGPVEGS
jgi:hypothetical protein